MRIPYKHAQETAVSFNIWIWAKRIMGTFAEWATSFFALLLFITLVADSRYNL